MPATERSVDVELRSGARETVTWRSLVETAREMAAPSGNLVTVWIDGMLRELIPTLEAALNVSAGSIAPRSAIDAADKLGLRIVQAERARAPVVASYSLRSDLARLPGQWAAIQNDRVIASAPDLSVLLALTRDRPAQILFVPKREDTPNDAS